MVESLKRHSAFLGQEEFQFTRGGFRGFDIVVPFPLPDMGIDLYQVGEVPDNVQNILQRKIGPEFPLF